MTKTQPDADEPNIVAGNSNTYVYITWQYDTVNHCITRTRSVGSGGGVVSTIALYVQDFNVRMEPARSAANVASGSVSFDLLLRAGVTMTMRTTKRTNLRKTSQNPATKTTTTLQISRRHRVKSKTKSRQLWRPIA